MTPHDFYHITTMIKMLLFIIVIVVLFGVFYVITYLREDQLSKDAKIVELKAKLSSAFPELHRVKMMKGASSYTLNKQKVYICTEKNGVTYDDNMLIYVTLHELAHVLCDEVGHTPKFIAIFTSLLDRAERHGLYDSNRQRVTNYCK